MRRGDERAFQRFLDEHWARLVSYIVGRVGDAELAKDIAQDAFMRLWQQRRELDPDRSITAYLYKTALHRTIDELRKREVRARWSERAREAPPPTEASDSPLRRLVDRELLQAVQRAIDRLPDRRREALTLVHVQDLSYREAAEAMGNAPQTVANQVAAALAQLRSELKGLLADPGDREPRRESAPADAP